MNSVKVPPVNANGVGHGHDDLGDTLRAFFRSEMPQPWPKLKLPTQERVIAPFPSPNGSTKFWPRRWLFNSRTALAAALGVLVVGFVLLSDTLKPRIGDLDPDHGTATNPITPPNDGDSDVILKESLKQDGNGPTQMEIKITPRKRG
jgi:hypothetical protein